MSSTRIGYVGGARGQGTLGLLCEDSVIDLSSRLDGATSPSQLLAQGAAGLERLRDAVADPRGLPRLPLPDASDGLACPLAPADGRMEVWAAGVTYLRSRNARMEESKEGGSFYDHVYEARRPELFFKATPSRVVDPEAPVGIRGDAAWNVPEPEIALVLDASLNLVGYTLGNDVSSRDIEGENPLYLPQAKVYRQCCSLGPWIVLADDTGPPPAFDVRLSVRRGGAVAFAGETSTAHMKRSFAELVAYLGRYNDFPEGVILLTGTGVVPPDEFTLEDGDVVEIASPTIGLLRNPVVRL